MHAVQRWGVTQVTSTVQQSLRDTFGEGSVMSLLPRGQTCWRLGLERSCAQRPDMLEAGSCAVVCPEARRAGGWALCGRFHRGQTCWRLGLAPLFAQRPGVGHTQEFMSLLATQETQHSLGIGRAWLHKASMARGGQVSGSLASQPITSGPGTPAQSGTQHPSTNPRKTQASAP
jgi:hypothetical protein